MALVVSYLPLFSRAMIHPVATPTEFFFATRAFRFKPQSLTVGGPALTLCTIAETFFFLFHVSRYVKLATKHNTSIFPKALRCYSTTWHSCPYAWFNTSGGFAEYYIMVEVNIGWLIRSDHRGSASMMVLYMILHVWHCSTLMITSLTPMSVSSITCKNPNAH